MTTLATGSSVSLTLAKNGFLEIATNGGLGSVSITPTGGALVTASWGPEPVRKRWQGYPEGAAVVLSNLTAPSVDYETDSGNLPDAVQALVSGAWILNGATSGQESGWIPYVGGMRLAYALDSGTASTTFAVDYSVNGTTSEGQAFTGTWASSTVFERTPPLWLSDYEARFIRVTVTSGGPLSVYRF